MRVTFVSDIHGNVEALARVAAQAELLVVLGDLLDYVDYHDPGNGILGQVFGVDRVLEFTALRSAHDFAALRTLNETLWAGVADPLGTLTDVVSQRYRQIAAVLTGPTLLTLGNVDVLDIWRQVAGDDLPCLDGEVVELGGYRFGFVGGGSARPGRAVRPTDHVWQPFVRSAEDFAGRSTSSARWTCCVPTSRRTSMCCATTGCRPGWRCTGPACSSTSTPAARLTRCSGTSTSRSPRGPGAAGPSASTSDTSNAPDGPTCSSWWAGSPVRR